MPSLRRSDKAVDLPFVEQQSARPLGLVIEAVSLQVFGDVGVKQHELGAGRAGMGLANGRLALPQRFHLRTGQRDAGLERIDDLIVEAGLAVIRHHLVGPIGLAGIFCHGVTR